MKRALVILLAALVLGALACFLSFSASPRVRCARWLRWTNELAWLAAEFQLSPEQTKRIAAMHAEYEPVCTEMCRRIAENNARLDRSSPENRGITTDMEGLLRESAEIQIECRKEMLKHIYAVAGRNVVGAESALRRTFENAGASTGTPYAGQGRTSHA
jgi:hypothetical protein